MGERSVFPKILHEFVISTEGVAVVEKPAGRSKFDHRFHRKEQIESVLIFQICGRFVKAGPSTTLRFAQDDRFYLFIRLK